MKSNDEFKIPPYSKKETVTINENLDNITNENDESKYE